MTREQLQYQFWKAFQKLSPSELERYPISITDLITDLWPHLGLETSICIEASPLPPMPYHFPDDF